MTATGHYLPDAQVLARLRVMEGDPAFEVLVPFVVDGGPTVLVDRGYVQARGGSQVPAFATLPNGDRDDHRPAARLRDRPAGQGPLHRAGLPAGLRHRHPPDVGLTGVPLAGSYVQLIENQPGGLGVIPLPHLDAGPFLSYGIQWIVFGVVAPDRSRVLRLLRTQGAPGGSGRRNRRSRRAGRTVDTPVTVEEKLADRYGRRR